jgi:hypothetical protein
MQSAAMIDVDVEKRSLEISKKRFPEKSFTLENRIVLFRVFLLLSQALILFEEEVRSKSSRAEIKKMGGGVFTWHILSVGIWTGAVATKAVVRKLVTDEKTEEVKAVAAKIDLWSGMLIEIPATVGVIITGWKLLKGR